MRHVLPHEHLKVYEKALAYVRAMAPQVDKWSPSHSVRDQMDRACESMVVNLVKAAYHQRSNLGSYHLECSLGSVLECASCIDVAVIKRLLDNGESEAAKQNLLDVARMEIGLRNSWCPSVREEQETYAGKPQGFSHETLHVYQQGLHLCELLVTDVLTPNMQQNRIARRVDEASTSLVLNIAEGNGRYSQLDQRQFITVAEEAGIKLAAYLDLLPMSNPESVQSAKSVLHEVMAMLIGLEGYLVRK